jgi:hypothetical protein
LEVEVLRFRGNVLSAALARIRPQFVTPTTAAIAPLRETMPIPGRPANCGIVSVATTGAHPAEIGKVIADVTARNDWPGHFTVVEPGFGCACSPTGAASVAGFTVGMFIIPHHSPFREISSLPLLDGRSSRNDECFGKITLRRQCSRFPDIPRIIPGCRRFVQDPKLNVDAQSKRSLA